MAIATLAVSALLRGDDGSLQLNFEPDLFQWGPLVGKRESVLLAGTSTFTALDPPGSAVLLIMVFASTPTGILTLKGVVGDVTGVEITPASGYQGFPLILPLKPGASVGILNAGATLAADLIWL